MARLISNPNRFPLSGKDTKIRCIRIADRQNDGVTILYKRDNSVEINLDKNFNQYYNS